MAAGKVEFQPFKITKQVDKASPDFFMTCCQGGHYEKCSLFIRKSGGAAGRSGVIYLKFDFLMVFVTEIGWSHDDTAPKEEITFDYGAVRVSYSRQLKSGQLEQAIDASFDATGKQYASWSKLLNSKEFEVPA